MPKQPLTGGGDSALTRCGGDAGEVLACGDTGRCICCSATPGLRYAKGKRAVAGSAGASPIPPPKGAEPSVSHNAGAPKLAANKSCPPGDVDLTQALAEPGETSESSAADRQPQTGPAAIALAATAAAIGAVEDIAGVAAHPGIASKVLAATRCRPGEQSACAGVTTLCLGEGVELTGGA